ncbi:MAG: DNA repair protein RecN [Wenzhouxiangellaceae bacterium]
MLRSITIRDFTIIDRLELELEPGFGAITGETGAGKSILIDALAQLLGERADTSLVAAGAERADLVAGFELGPDHPARDWLRQQALSEEMPLLLRRVIPASGASRAWIAGQPATVSQLRELGALLVEIHGQHEHQRLTDPRWQQRWLDRQVDPALRDTVQVQTEQWREARQALTTLERDAGDEQQRELLAWQVGELDRLALQEGEMEQLEAEQRRLASIEDLKLGIGEAVDALHGDEAASATQLVRRAARALEALLEREPALPEIAEMITTAAVNLDEAGRALQRLHQDLEHDPERLAELEQRLGRAGELARKHRIKAEQLPALHAELKGRLEGIEGLDERRAALNEALDKAESRWRSAALDLHQARRESGEMLARAVTATLAELGMDQARVEFRIEHDREAEISPAGADRIEILFSANPGQPPRPLARIASGGELSRFSLALIIAGAEDSEDKVRLFDEIDAGVGGETAHAVGRFLLKASRGGQAFCVTHLAQVAARADAQWRVLKRQEKNRTRVEIQRLDRASRIRELARMLGSGESDTGRRHAETMLDSAPGS